MNSALKTIAIYPSLILSFIALAIIFVTATTYLQLAVAVVFYPIFIFIAYKMMPRRSVVSTPRQSEVAATVTKKSETTKTTIGISDIDKRVFLKLIGGAGIFLFLFSLINRKTEGLFFRSIPGQSGRLALEDTQGNKVDPARNQPLDGYRITEFEDNINSFYGFINKDGGWYIMKVDTNTGSFRYAKGDTNFPAGWSSREKLKYDYFSDIF